MTCRRANDVLKVYFASLVLSLTLTLFIIIGIKNDSHSKTVKPLKSKVMRMDKTKGKSLYTRESNEIIQAHQKERERQRW
jgi:hypothetical protein